VKKKVLFIIEWVFFYVIIICQGFTNLDVMFNMLGGGLNDELGFDCFSSYNRCFFIF